MAWELILFLWIMTLHEDRGRDDCLVRRVAYWRLYTFNDLALVSRRFHGSLMELLHEGVDKASLLFHEALVRTMSVEWVAREVFTDFPWRHDAACQAIAVSMLRWKPIRRPREPPGPCPSCWVSYARDGRIKAVSSGYLQHVAEVYRRLYVNECLRPKMYGNTGNHCRLACWGRTVSEPRLVVSDSLRERRRSRSLPHE